MPIKLFCCLLVILIGSYAGFAKARQYKDRVKQLSECELFLSRLKTYIGGSNASTKQIFLNLANTDSLSELVFIKNTSIRLETEPNFPIVFTECVEQAKSELALKDEDYIPLLNLGELIGSYDTQGVLNGIELSKELIRQSQLDAIEQSQTNGKLARSLGVLAGIAVAILIL
ncbi:MAG: stage III sporulation protein AB [Oscillospiraceae bacterium]